MVQELTGTPLVFKSKEELIRLALKLAEIENDPDALDLDAVTDDDIEKLERMLDSLDDKIYAAGSRFFLEN